MILKMLIQILNNVKAKKKKSLSHTPTNVARIGIHVEPILQRCPTRQF